MIWFQTIRNVLVSVAWPADALTESRVDGCRLGTRSARRLRARFTAVATPLTVRRRVLLPAILTPLACKISEPAVVLRRTVTRARWELLLNLTPSARNDT